MLYLFFLRIHPSSSTAATSAFGNADARPEQIAATVSLPTPTCVAANTRQISQIQILPQGRGRDIGMHAAPSIFAPQRTYFISLLQASFRVLACLDGPISGGLIWGVSVSCPSTESPKCRWS